MLPSYLELIVLQTCKEYTLPSFKTTDEAQIAALAARALDQTQNLLAAMALTNPTQSCEPQEAH